METLLSILIIFLVALAAAAVGFYTTKERRKQAVKLMLYGGAPAAVCLGLILFLRGVLPPALLLVLSAIEAGGTLAAFVGYAFFVLGLQAKPTESPLNHLVSQIAAVLFGILVLIGGMVAGFVLVADAIPSK